MDLSGRVVLLTGAVGNLGMACVRALRAAGARLALADRSGERLRQGFKDLHASGEHLLTGNIDLSSADSCERLAREVAERFGRIDGLVHTVGAYRGGKTVGEMLPEDWELLLGANLRTTVNVCRAVLPHMLRQSRGTIVTIASRHALRAPSGEAAYAASKAAVLRLTEALSAEHRAQGINANCILPSTLDTPQNRAANPGADVSRWVDPASVADVVVFLCSAVARDLHGVALPVGPEL